MMKRMSMSVYITNFVYQFSCHTSNNATILIFFLAVFRSSRPEVFCKKGALRNFAKFTGKHLHQSLIYNKVAGLMPATLSKMGLWNSYFPVNCTKFLRTPFLTEHLRWLLLIFFFFFFAISFTKRAIFITMFKTEPEQSTKKAEN